MYRYCRYTIKPYFLQYRFKILSRGDIGVFPLTCQGDPVDFAGAVLFEEGGAGDKCVAGRGDIVDEPDSFVSEKILWGTL